MMDLSQYPTHETDALRESFSNGVTWQYDELLRFAKAQTLLCESLERRNGALRFTLQKATDECLWRSDSEFPLSAEKSQELWAMAVETLEATKPQA